MVLCSLSIAIIWLAVPAHAESIVLVRGTASTPDEAERSCARSLAQRLSCWLNDMNVPHRVIDDEAVTTETLKSTRVLILSYNPYLPKREFDALKIFVEQGGKLIVFYSADPELAKLLNMRLGRYMASDTHGRWSIIRFNESAPAHLPKTVLQESYNIRPVYTASKDSRVIAWWEEKGTRLRQGYAEASKRHNRLRENATASQEGTEREGQGREPAWVQSDNGLWMSHILLDDGDTESKKQMLLGLIAVYEPSVWRTAAARHLEICGRLGKFRDFEHAVQSIKRESSGSPREPLVKAALSQAEVLHKEMLQLFDKQKYPFVVEKSRDLTRLLIEAYSCTFAAIPKQSKLQNTRKEFRGVWDHSGTGLYPGDWNHTCKLLADYGFTDIIPNMLWPGLVHYDSRILPKSETFRRYGDQIKQCVGAAHRHKLRVHAWKVCWNLDCASDSFKKQMKKQGRLQVSDSGQTLNWLCPSHPENLKLEKDGIREIVRNYAVDGIHLDYIRYQNSHVCYCSGCKERFGKKIGRSLRNWPAVVRSGAMKQEYNQWRCAQITRFVRDVKAMVSAVNPDIKLSAAVFGKYPMCIDSVAQDWGMWLRNGYVDFVCPMNYTSDLIEFTRLTQSQLALPSANRRVFPGIGVTASESRLDPVQVVDQIVALRQKGAAGFVLFDLNRRLETEILPALFSLYP